MTVLTPCGQPGCPELVPSGRCSRHARQPWARRRSPKRNYNTPEYRQERVAALERDRYRCVDCGRPANVTDHVDRFGPDHRDNLRTRCPRCHNRHTAAQSRGAR